VLQPPPTKRQRWARNKAAFRQRRNAKEWMYGLPLRQAIVDEAMDMLIREGLKIEDRYDRRQIGKALAPVVEHCLRQIRTGAFRFIICLRR
jgi:hypothetical protein